MDKDTGLKATLQEKPHVTNERGDPAVMGVCGVAMSARLDYNKPTDSRYGYSPVEEYAPGEEEAAFVEEEDVLIDPTPPEEEEDDA